MFSVILLIIDFERLSQPIVAKYVEKVRDGDMPLRQKR